MSLFKTIARRFQRQSNPSRHVDPMEAYDLWAATYDEQPENLVLRLADTAFDGLLAQVDLQNKTIVDVGCGTGRRWDQILQKKPALLTGYDVSIEMLKRLRCKFPEAKAWLLQDNALRETENNSTDIVISTLALAHIADLARAFGEWNRILRHQGEILLTDFHPAALENGADRTFRYAGQLISIRNYLHPIDEVRRLSRQLGWADAGFMEMKIDETLRRYYAEQDALPLYRRFRNTPILYGWHLKKA